MHLKMCFCLWSHPPSEKSHPPSKILDPPLTCDTCKYFNSSTTRIKNDSTHIVILVAMILTSGFPYAVFVHMSATQINKNKQEFWCYTNLSDMWNIRNRIVSSKRQ
jgi:hypothetical protein